MTKTGVRIQILPKSVSIKGSRTVWYCKRVSCTGEPDLENWIRPSCSWFYLLPIERLLSRDATMRLVIWAWECMLDLMHDRFFWPCMAVQVEHIGKCHPCLAFKARQPKAPLENIMATHPLELVHLDFLCLEPGKGQEENVLVITDHFTR